MAGIGKALKGIGNVLKKYKNKESTAKWVDRHTNPGEVKPGKLLKNTLKGAGAAIGVGIGAEKISTHRRKKRRTRKAVGGLLSKGFKVLKGPANKFRMDQAQRLKDYHRKTKIKKRRAGRIEEGKSKTFHEKYIKPLASEAKATLSKGQHPKSWRRQQLKGIK